MPDILTRTTPTRRTLLGRLHNLNDDPSWQDFFNTYWKLIYGVAIKCGLTETEAEEVVQETIITVARKMPTFVYNPAVGSFKSWLLNIARWRIQDQYRKRQRNGLLRQATAEGSNQAMAAEQVPDPASLTLEAIWEEDWKRNLIDAAIAKVRQRVNPRQFQLFHLHVIKGWPALKVAHKLGASLDRIYYAKYKVACLVRKEVKRLEEKWI
jgi:RNA polymerase sigma-70 factor (ECF subfamily)